MINVTQYADEYLSELIEKKDFDCDIRIFVSEPGTPRAETCLASVSYTHLTLPTITEV